MEHRLVFAVVAKERYVFAEVHILEVIGDKATVTTLNAFAKIFEHVSLGFHKAKEIPTPYAQVVLTI